MWFNCSNCGFDAGENKFCPNCGSKIIIEQEQSRCPNCGNEVGDSAFCSSCGTKIAGGNKETFHSHSERVELDKGSSSTLDKVLDIDEKVSGKFGKLLGKSKVMDSVLDKSASISYKRNSMHVDNGMNRKYFEKIEPVFLEVCDSIDDEFVKSILIYQRSMMGSSSGIAGAVASQIYTPTKDLSHDEAIKFYQNMANEIVAEINQEKSKGTFDEEEFYKKKIKENTINNISVLGFSKSIKTYKNNQK